MALGRWSRIRKVSSSLGDRVKETTKYLGGLQGLDPLDNSKETDARVVALRSGWYAMGGTWTEQLPWAFKRTQFRLSS